MKDLQMNYLHLLLAAEVRRLALDLRDKAAATHANTTELRGHSWQAANDQWLNKHPVTEFEAEAYELIAATARRIPALTGYDTRD
ncbi:MAG: hypothetical protein V4724_18655 [Pseudomonadota bacterium]